MCKSNESLIDLRIMKQIFTYRQSGIDDLTKLKNLGIISYSEYASVLSKKNWNKLNTILHDEERLAILMNKSTVFVCESGQEIVGMIFYFPHGNPTEIFDADWAYIRFLGVDPAYRSHGIGKQLTKLCINLAVQTHEKTIALHTGDFMSSARKMYKQMGFERKGAFEQFGKKYWIYNFKLKETPDL
jgi:ribosomal protein S18 acetylase RimI-like enzyme